MANISLLNLSCCHVCGEWMRKDNDLMLQHLNTEHRTTGRGMFICPFCIKPYTRKWTLDRHVITIHQKPAPAMSKITVRKPNDSKITKRKKPYYWPNHFTPTSVQFRVIYANNSPYPSCSQAAVNHPPRTLPLRQNSPSSHI